MPGSRGSRPRLYHPGRTSGSVLTLLCLCRQERVGSSQSSSPMPGHALPHGRGLPLPPWGNEGWCRTSTNRLTSWTRALCQSFRLTRCGAYERKAELVKLTILVNASRSMRSASIPVAQRTRAREPWARRLVCGSGLKDRSRASSSRFAPITGPLSAGRISPAETESRAYTKKNAQRNVAATVLLRADHQPARRIFLESKKTGQEAPCAQVGERVRFPRSRPLPIAALKDLNSVLGVPDARPILISELSVRDAKGPFSRPIGLRHSPGSPR